MSIALSDRTKTGCGVERFIFILFSAGSGHCAKMLWRPGAVDPKRPILCFAFDLADKRRDPLNGLCVDQERRMALTLDGMSQAVRISPHHFG